MQLERNRGGQLVLAANDVARHASTHTGIHSRYANWWWRPLITSLTVGEGTAVAMMARHTGSLDAGLLTFVEAMVFRRAVDTSALDRKARMCPAHLPII